MGRPIKQSDLVRTIGNHYEVVEFELEFKQEGAGANCKVMINGKQAVAGVSYDKTSKSATPDRNQCGQIANLAHNIAEAEYERNHADKTVPKKLSSDTIRGG